MISSGDIETYLNSSTPDVVTKHPGMTSQKERFLLYGLAKNYFTGQGIIVDAGVFLGASTVAFAEGLLDNSKLTSERPHPIKSYDIAIWLQQFDKYLGDGPVAEVFRRFNLKHEDSFEAPLKEVLKKYEKLQSFNVGDIVKLAPAHNEPIEIAFYDCLKNYERDCAAFFAFSPHYIPGRTVVLQQDYFYEDAAFNKIRQEFYSEHFDFLAEVDDTAVFLFKKHIPDLQSRADPVLNISVAKQVALIEQASARSSTDKGRIRVRLAGLRHALDHTRYSLAEEIAVSLRIQIEQAQEKVFNLRIQQTFNKLITLLNAHLPFENNIKAIEHKH